jgi:hypothetical protein
MSEHEISDDEGDDAEFDDVDELDEGDDSEFDDDREPFVEPEPDGSPEAALRRLRRTRQLHRLGNIEWFEAAYRVYILGIFGGGSILWLSSGLQDATVGASTAADVSTHAPAILGLFAAFAVLAGLRGGSQGGPIALEAADVVHVMLSPVDRRAALLRPAVQRIRGAVFAGAVAGAIAGQFAGRRLPGSLLAWAGGGVLFGATVGLLWAGSALLAHAVRLPRWAATAGGLTLLVWQAVAAARTLPGPGNSVGDLALWGWRQHPTDLITTVVALVAVAVGLVQLRRISLEALARRAALVAQLRFAVTMQDLRTVILLRRQLNQEHPRRRPWIRLGAPQRTGFRVLMWRRGMHGILRFPLTRIVRILALAAGIGVLQAATVRGTTPAVLGSALLGFVLGLELMEPLAQEVDQPDHTDSFPVPRGELMYRHLIAPMMLLVPLAVVAAAAAVLTLGADTRAIAPAAILALPTLMGGVCGGVVSIVRDAPDPLSSVNQQTFVPPEMAGVSTTVRLLWPFVISTLGTCTVLLPRQALRNGDSLAGAATRGAMGSLLITGLVCYWVKVRDEVRKKIRSFMEEGRAQTAAQRQQRSSA